MHYLKVSKEELFHFNCSNCSKWWAIGDAPIKPYWYCPWCGVTLLNEKVVKKENTKMGNSKSLIGIAGSAGVGKTTMANAFIVYQGYTLLSYGKPLKESLIAMTGLDRKYFYDSEYKEKEIEGLPGMTSRILMQKFGTEFTRDMVSPDFWLWRMKQQITSNLSDFIIVDDIRFHNEAWLIRDLGGVILHLERDFESPTTQNDHESEQGVPRMKNDFVITGDTPQEAYGMAEKAVATFMKA